MRAVVAAPVAVPLATKQFQYSVNALTARCMRECASAVLLVHCCMQTAAQA
jgi:hypothetical protein